ncbi:FAD/NAD(P)-binding protein (plasmid) [Paracoccus sp. MA]|uniref:FAD/NAD(P)-binding protein n=1 Tax=Paracoccus sp. MA TaxID=2895796 RepID=UPI001E335948|nr:FAD/NAD(P)-binding protein [Paracoccus sp. MA]UFM67392.1 FAD/NAD(P)-binding protein [Paracoccus sp. MA]
MTAIQNPLRIVILGGGFTGASLAWQLARMRLPVRLTVVEPRPELGRGLAYSATDPAHRLNVPAHRMSIDPENRSDFADWLAENPDLPDPQATAPNGDLYVQRALFGRYVAERLAPHLASGAVRHIRARVSDVAHGANGDLLLLLSDDNRIHADLLVLASGHPAPALPRPLAGLAGSSLLVADPGDAEALAAVPQQARVLILGAGLSAADAVATLDRQGHAGQITCLSRRGLQARGQGAAEHDSQADFTAPPARRVSDLLRRVRHAIVDDQARGNGWHATFWRLRAQAPQIWAALDMTERRRFLRHLRVWWDVHRYRLAPQTEAVLARLTDQSRLEFVAGHLLDAARRGGGVDVRWRPRGRSQPQQAHFDRIIVTTGPAQDRCIDANPALGALARLGLIVPCPLGLGLATTEICRALDAQGRASNRILIAGPLARGHLGELTGAPECASQTSQIAREIARHALLGPILHPAAARPAVAAGHRPPLS